MLTLNEMKAKRDAEIATVKDRVALIKRALEENKVSRRCAVRSVAKRRLIAS
jgi:hypothetical protein